MQNHLAPEVSSQESTQGQCSIILWATYVYTCNLVTYLAKMLFYGQKCQESAQAYSESFCEWPTSVT